MSAINQSRFSELLKRVFALKESGVLVNALEDVFPSFALNDPTSPEVYRYRNENLFSAGTQIAAAVGAPSRLWLFNPDTSGVLVLVYSLHIAIAPAGTVDVFISSASPPGATGVQTAARDSRFQVSNAVGTSSAATVTRDNTGAAAPGGRIAAHFAFGASETVEVDFPAVLSPASGLVVATSAANFQLDVTLLWSELIRDPNER